MAQHFFSVFGRLPRHSEGSPYIALVLRIAPPPADKLIEGNFAVAVVVPVIATSQRSFVSDRPAKKHNAISTMETQRKAEKETAVAHSHVLHRRV